MKPYGIGIDIIETERIRKIIGKTPGFLKRFFSRSETEYCLKHRNKYERFAAKFSAKEAVIKALGDKNIPLKEIEIINEFSGKPVARLGKKIRFDLMISVSHTKNYACAVCMAFKK